MHEHLRALVEQATERFPQVVPRKMFGCEVWLAGGHIFALLWKTGRVAVRLPEPAARAEAMALLGAQPWSPHPGRPMSNWVLLPETLHDDEDAIGDWLRRAHALALALALTMKAKPAKAKLKAKPKPATKAKLKAKPKPATKAKLKAKPKPVATRPAAATTTRTSATRRP